MRVRLLVSKVKLSHIACESTEWYSRFARQFGSWLSCQQAPTSAWVIPLSDTAQEKCRPISTTGLMFVVALFIIAPNWKQTNISITGEQILELWYIPLEDSYLLMKRSHCDTVHSPHEVENHHSQSDQPGTELSYWHDSIRWAARADWTRLWWWPSA